MTAEFVLFAAEQVLVAGQTQQPAERLDLPVSIRQQMRLTRTVRRFHQQFQNVNGVICHSLPKHEALVLRETVHAIQQPFREVVPLDQHDRASSPRYFLLLKSLLNALPLAGIQHFQILNSRAASGAAAKHKG